MSCLVSKLCQETPADLKEHAALFAHDFQAVRHHAHACTGPLRCGRCAESHLTKLCESSFNMCALCDAHHKYGSSRCHARKARKSAKTHARFPTGEDGPLQAVRSEERKDLNPSLDSPVVNLPAPQNEHVLAKEKVHSNLEPAKIHSQAADKPTLSAQQLHNRKSATENTLETNKSAKRGLPFTTNCYQHAQEPRVEKRRNLTSKELEKRRGISEDPVPL